MFYKININLKIQGGSKPTIRGGRIPPCSPEINAASELKRFGAFSSLW